MSKDYHPIEVLLGQDGSWAIEGVPDGSMGARRVFRFLLGEEPANDTYETNPLWDWLYFPPGSLTQPQRERMLSLGKINEQGTWVYKLHEVEHVERPGQYTESFFDILKEPVVGRIVAASVTVVLLAAAGFFWVNSREPGSAEAGLGDVIAAAQSPHVAPGFFDRLSVRFTDGDRFTVPLAASDVVHRGSSSIVLAGFGESAFFIESEDIGETVSNELQLPPAALEFDTRGGADGVLAQRPDGSWNAAKLTELRKGRLEPGKNSAGIRFDDPATFAVGTRYDFAGGVERSGEAFLVFALPRMAPPFRVTVKAEDPGLHALLAYAADHNHTVKVTGTLESLTEPEERAASRVVGGVGPEIGLYVFRTGFIAGGGG